MGLAGRGSTSTSKISTTLLLVRLLLAFQEDGWGRTGGKFHPQNFGKGCVHKENGVKAGNMVGQRETRAVEWWWLFFGGLK